MIVLGLTGSMAMGKSTTSAMFAKAGAAVYDADAAVHALYAAGGPAGAKLSAIFPQAVTASGAVRRDVLRSLLADDPGRLASLEAAIFPLLAEQRRARLAAAEQDGRRLAILDIPLLFETGADDLVDAVVVVTAAPEVQRDRVMAREGMDEATFALLSARQTPDDEKRRRADFLVFTDQGLRSAAHQVQDIVATVLAPRWRAPRRRGLAMDVGRPDIARMQSGGLE